jgi:hypothetical protein
MSAKKIVPMYDGQEDDRVMLIKLLREEARDGKGIAKIQAAKLLWEMMGKPTQRPDTHDDDKPITFLIAGPLNDDEISCHEAAVGDNPAPSED